MTQQLRAAGLLAACPRLPVLAGRHGAHPLQDRRDYCVAKRRHRLPLAQSHFDRRPRVPAHGLFLRTVAEAALEVADTTNAKPRRIGKRFVCQAGGQPEPA